MLQTDYCQCHRASITNSQRCGRFSSSQQLFTVHYSMAHTCELADVILLCITIKLKVAELKLAWRLCHFKGETLPFLGNQNVKKLTYSGFGQLGHIACLI